MRVFVFHTVSAWLCSNFKCSDKTLKLLGGKVSQSFLFISRAANFFTRSGLKFISLTESK